MPSVRTRLKALFRDPEGKQHHVSAAFAGVLLLAALTALYRGAQGGPAVPLLRIEGETRVETAVAASRHWSSSTTVVLAGADAADVVALRAAACAGELDAPLLLLPPTGRSQVVDTRLGELGASRLIEVGEPTGVSGVERPGERTVLGEAHCPAAELTTTRLLAVPRRLRAVLPPVTADGSERERTVTRLVIAAGGDRPGVPDAAVAVALARHLERGGALTPVAVALVDRGAEGELRRDLRRHGATITGAIVVGGDAALAQRVREDVSRAMVARDPNSVFAAVVGAVDRLGQLVLALLAILAATVATAATARAVAGSSPGPRATWSSVADLFRSRSGGSSGPAGPAAHGQPPPVHDTAAVQEQTSTSTARLQHLLEGRLTAAHTFEAAAAWLHASTPRAAGHLSALSEAHRSQAGDLASVLAARTGQARLPAVPVVEHAPRPPAAFVDAALDAEARLLQEGTRLVLDVTSGGDEGLRADVARHLARQHAELLTPLWALRRIVQSAGDHWTAVDAALGQASGAPPRAPSAVKAVAPEHAREQAPERVMGTEALAAAPEARTPEVRLLVVHGIGDQKPGSTVQRWAEALDAWGRRRKGWTSEVVECELTGDPATATLRMSVQDEEGQRSTMLVRITEGHWGDAFPEPTVGRVLRWLLTVGPALAAVQARALLGRRATWAGTYRASTALLPLTVGALLLAVAAPVLVVGVLVLLVLSALPIDAARKSVGKVLGILATTIGDSFLFVADPVSRAAMVSRVRAQLEALDTTQTAPGSRLAPPAPIVVLAHSQGAAVAYRALTSPGSRGGSDRLRGFITVGSALGRLRDVQGLDPVPWWITGASVTAALTLAAGSVGLTPLWASVLAAVLWSVVLWRWAGERSRQSDEDAERVPIDHWLDVWAPFDFVPNGAAMHAESPVYEHHLVPGDLSVTRDHLRYSQDAAEVLPRIVGVLRRAAGFTGPPVTMYRATSDREHPFAFRHWWSFILRLLPIGVAVVLLWQTDEAAWAHWLLTVLPDTARTSVEAALGPVVRLLELVRPGSPQLDTVLGWALVLGQGVVASAVVRRAAGFARDRDVGRWMSSDLRWGRKAWSAVCVGLLVLTAVVLLPVDRWRDGPRWSAQAVADAYVAALAEGRADRLCEALGDPAGCRKRAATSLAAVCDDAREAYGTVEAVVLGSGATRRVAVDFSPEERPACPASGSAAVQRFQVQRRTDRWVVVCPGGGGQTAMAGC